MTPEQKAIAKERGAKAMKEMKDCGFPGKKTVVVIKRLLKSLDFDWELIEAENYSILVDAIISFDESEEQRPLKARTGEEEEEEDCNGQIVNAEVPLLRKRTASNQEELPLTGDFIVKKPKLEVECTPEKDIQDNGFTRNSRGSTDISSPDASSRLGQSGPVNSHVNAKGKGILIEASHGQSGTNSTRACQKDKAPAVGISIDTSRRQLIPISLRAHRRDKAHVVERSQPVVIFKEPKPEPDIEPISEKVAPNTAHGYVADVIPDSHPPMLEIPIANVPFHCTTSKDEDSNRKNNSVEDGCPSQEKNGCSSQENISQATSYPYTDKERSAEGVVLPNSSSAEIELASSANGKVKFLLSWEVGNADHQMPMADSIINLVEERCLKSGDVQAELSLKGILQETCEMVSELCKSSNSGLGSLANEIPSLATLKMPRTETSCQGLCSSSNFVPISSEGEVPGLVSLNVEANFEAVTSNSTGPET